MPYIKKTDRHRLNVDTPKTAGELNFMVTSMVLTYIKEKGLNYQHINDVLGAIEGAKMEFYRRHVVPYENTKISENGDL